MRNFGQQYSDDDYAAVERHPDDPFNEEQLARTAGPLAAEPRFGDRLRALAGSVETGTLTGREAFALARAIDEDATVTLTAYHDQLLRIYEGEVMLALRRVEALVDELRYTVTYPPDQGFTGNSKDVLDVEAFLSRLPAIFVQGDSPHTDG